MNTHVDKGSENKSPAAANHIPNLKSADKLPSIDSRPAVVAQRKLKELINSSSKVQQLKAYQDMANDYHNKPIQKKENNTGLPDTLKTGIENLSGYSMDDVKVHYNSDKPSQLQAHAYAQGTEIHIASGQEKHLAHEAWHVVQQKQGRVQPTVQRKGLLNINDDAGLEKEADVMGGKAFDLGNQNDIKNIGLKQNKTAQTTLISQPFQLSTNIIQMVTGIPRPTFTKEVKNSIQLDKGQHRRHVVMSSRMREAVWSYHMTPPKDSFIFQSRRKELQKIVGENTLRSEMGEIIHLVHNSMGNLFAGKGSENTAIGFSVNPLYFIALKITSKELKSYEDVKKEVMKWHNKGIFGFALADKKSIGEILINWLENTENHDEDMYTIASAIRDFAFSCSFDLAYIKGDDDEGDIFPDHIDENIQKKLLEVAQILEETITSPMNDHKLYLALEYLVEISNKF